MNGLMERTVRNGDIGEPQRYIEFVPEPVPAEAPVTEPAVDPVPVEVPVEEPVPA